MKNEMLENYFVKGQLDIDMVIKDFYDYIYAIVKKSVSIYVSNEDIEEITADVFVAIWKRSNILLKTTPIKAYLIGIAKKLVKNKYRQTESNVSIFDYESKLIGFENIEEIVEMNEQENTIYNCVKKLKPEEYQVFIMFYYESKTVKEIAKKLQCTENKVKIILHKVRKKIKKFLKDGGYGYGE